MFEQGNYIMYSNYGVCLIDKIEEKTVDKVNKMYYILHPVNDTNSKITTPIDNTKVKIRAIMPPEKAENILEAISDSNVIRIEDKKERDQTYTKILKEGDPFELVDIINALLIEEIEKKADGKNISATDKKYLEKAERLLYPELSVSLGVDVEEIIQRVTDIHKELI